jgi:hypothetical protein
MTPKPTAAEKEAERQAARERMRQELLEQNPSFNPSLARREVGLLVPAPRSVDPPPERALPLEPGPPAAPRNASPAENESAGAPATSIPVVPGVAVPLESAATEPAPVPPAVPTVRMAPLPERARAEAMRAFKTPPRSRKNNVRVSHRVYNLVAAYDAAHGRITKLKVLSWLLYNHLPKAGKEIPRYLTKEPPEEARECNLSFVEDAGLQERFDCLEAEGTPRVDIIEQIVLNNLPQAERTYRPKRRRRSLL